MLQNFTEHIRQEGLPENATDTQGLLGGTAEMVLPERSRGTVYWLKVPASSAPLWVSQVAQHVAPQSVSEVIGLTRMPEAGVGEVA